MTQIGEIIEVVDVPEEMPITLPEPEAVPSTPGQVPAADPVPAGWWETRYAEAGTHSPGSPGNPGGTP